MGLLRAANLKPPWGDRSIAGGKPVLAGVAPGRTEKDTGAPIVGDRGHGYNNIAMLSVAPCGA